MVRPLTVSVTGAEPWASAPVDIDSNDVDPSKIVTDQIRFPLPSVNSALCTVAPGAPTNETEPPAAVIPVGGSCQAGTVAADGGENPCTQASDCGWLAVLV